MRRAILTLALMAGVLGIQSHRPAAAQSAGEALRTALESGNITEFLRQPPAGSPEAQMAIGVGRFVGAVEGLVQGLHGFGLTTPTNPFLPVLRLPVPPNPAPRAVDYESLRALYQRFLDELAITRTILLAVPPTDAKIVLDLDRIAIRAVAGSQGDAGRLQIVRVLQAMGWGARPAQPTQSPEWTVAFDRSDILWLAGYTHVLSATFEFILAHDWRTTFDATAHLFFTGARSPTHFDSTFPVPGDPRRPRPDLAMGGIADQIALVHLIRWPAGDRARMQRAKAHLKGMITVSRQMWAAILAETDDDREWLPGPQQTNRAVPSLPITADMVAGWRSTLDTMEAVLEGRVLVPHWRLSKGIDLSKVFDDPQPFDAVLWVTGHGAVPFLRDGPMLTREHWAGWNATFRGSFLSYMVFIN